MKKYWKYFWNGFGSVLEIFPINHDFDRYNNFDLMSDFESDRKALRSDWNNVGNDMRKAIDSLQYGRRGK